MPPKEKGLNFQEVAKRLKQFGPNLLPEKPPPSNFIIFLSQLRSPLVYVLLLAGVAGLGLQISPFVVPGLGRFLGVIPLNIGQWGIVFASSVLMFIIIEISKSVFRLTARTSKT